MLTRSYRQPQQIFVNVNADKTEFKFRFEFPKSGRREYVEFVMPPGQMMALTEGLQALQRKYNIPLRTARLKGKPVLRLVTTAEE